MKIKFPIQKSDGKHIKYVVIFGNLDKNFLSEYSDQHFVNPPLRTDG